MDEHDENRIKTSHDYILDNMATELSDVRANLSLATEALGRLSNYYANLVKVIREYEDAVMEKCKQAYEMGLADRTLGTNDIPHNPEVAQSVSVSAGDRKREAKPLSAPGKPSLKEYVKEILARSKYAVPADILRFRVATDDNGIKLLKFRLDQNTEKPGCAFRYVEEFMVYAHRDMANTVKEFDDAVANLHMVRIPLKQSGHDDWDSIN